MRQPGEKTEGRARQIDVNSSMTCQCMRCNAAYVRSNAEDAFFLIAPPPPTNQAACSPPPRRQHANVLQQSDQPSCSVSPLLHLDD